MRRSESTLLRWMFVQKTRKQQSKVDPLIKERVFSHMGYAGCWMVALWYGALLTKAPATLFEWFRPFLSEPFLFIIRLIIGSVAIGVLSLAGIYFNLRATRWILYAITFLGLPVLFGLSALPISVYAIFPLSHLMGIALLAWYKTDYVWVRRILGLLPLGTLAWIWGTLETDVSSGTMILLGSFSLGWTWLIYSQYRNLLNELLLRGHPEDTTGERSVCIGLATFWLLPIFIVDGKGWLLSGGPKRK